MAYGHNRLFVVPKMVGDEDGRRFFVAGDICNPNKVESLLSFTETDYWAGGGAFSLPTELGFIKGMVLQRNASSGNGYGPLIVFSRNGVSAFAVNLPRVRITDPTTHEILSLGWQDQDISQVLFMDAGTASPFGVLTQNSDVLFRGADGLRSIALTISEGSSTLRNLSMSGEVKELFENDTEAQLFHATQGFADNRLYMTVLPVGDNGWKGLACLDFAPVDNVKQRSPPAYDGVVTGAIFLMEFTAQYGGRDRHFAFVQRDGKTELVVQDDAATTDPYGGIVEARLYTRRMSFYDSGGRPVPTVRKRLTQARLWFTDMEGDCTVDVYCRADGFPWWTKLGETATFQAPVSAGGKPQQRLAVNFGPNAPSCDPVGSMDGYTGYGFQIAVLWTGKLAISRCSVSAEGLPDEAATPCTATENVELLAATAENVYDLEATDFEYRW